MATLKELAEDYREAAVKLRLGLEDAKSRRKQVSVEDQGAIDAEIKLIQTMLKDVREVGAVAQHYYEPGYWRGRQFTI